MRGFPSAVVVALALGACMPRHRSYFAAVTVSVDPAVAAQTEMPARLCLGEVDPRTGKLFQGGATVRRGTDGSGPAFLCRPPPAWTTRSFEWWIYGALVLEDIPLVGWLEPAPDLKAQCAAPDAVPYRRAQGAGARGPEVCKGFDPQKPHGRAVAFPTSDRARWESSDRDEVAMAIASAPPTTPTGRPPSEDVACQSARTRVHAAVEAAAAGCSVDEDCDLFQTCYAVTRTSTPRLWKLHEEAKAACRGPTDSFITCVRSAVRCQQGHCIRSGQTVR